MVSRFRRWLGVLPALPAADWRILSRRLEKVAGAQSKNPMETLESARELRDELLRCTPVMRIKDKIRLLQTISKAKIQALEWEDSQVFGELDLIGSQVLRVL